MRPGDGLLTLVTAPPAEPVTLVEARAQANIIASGSPETSEHDSRLTALITSARHTIEEWTGRALVEQTWDWLLPRFPGCEGFTIPKPPLISVTHIKYIDANGTEQTVSSSDYSVIAPAGPACTYGRIDLAYGASWPSPRDQRDAVRVRFVAGYEPSGSPPSDYAANVPRPLRDAMLLLISDLFEHREAQFVGVSVAENMAVQRLLSVFTQRTF